MNKTARVIITTECNLKCTYCCNKLKKVQEKFKMSTFDQIVESNYDNYCITGGEPFLEFEKTLKLCKELTQAGKNVYLYTNGLLIGYYELITLSHYVDGINVGVHSAQYADKYQQLEYWLKGMKISYRFLISDKDLTNYDLGNTSYWKMNECSMDNEDWFII